MIQEDYVSFETAKFLKEKGFDEDIDLWYDENGDKFFKYHYEISRDWRVRQNQQVYQCPTLQMAMKWLREVHNRYITILTSCELDYPTFIIRIEHYTKPLFFTDIQSNELYDSYEDACEAAIKYCLENLI